jgi:hypothetical protein
MDGLRMIIACLVGLTASPAAADDLLRMFADCAGRYSAETEHGWLVNPGESDTFRQKRDQFADLAATLGDGPQVMGWRVAAKAAQRDLLMQATFTGNEKASRTALALREACDRLLPGS